MISAAPSAPPVPAAAAELIASFERKHPGATVFLWQLQDDGWRCVHPAQVGAAVAPESAGCWYPVPGASPPLALAVSGGGAEPGGVEFLADVIGKLIAYEREARSSARELSERYEEINLLYSISEILGSVLSLETAAHRILEEVADVMGARRASLWVHDPEADELALAAAVGEEGLAGPIKCDDRHSVTARVFRERQPLNVDHGRRMPIGSRLEPAPRGRESYLSVPINFTPPVGETRTIGVITLIGRRSGAPFSAGDTRLLSAIASQIGAALEAQRLVRETLRRERLVREVELAHDLQLKLLPDVADFEGLGDVAARCVPADSVGGDFYYLFRLSQRRLGVMIGDVSGHGFPAALMMALTISAVAIYAQDALPPAEVLRNVHRALISELESTETYLTLYYGVLDPSAGRLVYSNAGHPHAFQVTAAGVALRMDATNPPLGTVTFDEYHESEVLWNPGEDLLCLFTDGLSDAFAGGEASLVREVVRLRSEPARKILDRLFRRARSSHMSAPPDDRTAVLVRI